MTKKSAALLTVTAAVCFALFGCAKPTRKQYAALLHQCRDANREHLRMLKEYAGAKCEKAPAQKFGAVEYNLGGIH